MKYFLSLICICILLVGVSCKTQLLSPKNVNTEVFIDVLLINGDVYTGELLDAQKLDVGIKDDRIVFVGKAANHKLTVQKTIDIGGYVLSPGFIDPHTHAENLLNSSNRTTRTLLPYIMQGVTTVVTGNDGYGSIHTGTLLEEWTKNGIGANAAFLVGFGSIRKEVLGNSSAAPSTAQIEQMKQIVEKSMREGAFGISTGLAYIPQNFSTTEEVKQVVSPVIKYKGIYDTHMRTQGTGSINAINEVLAIGEGTDLRLHISHIKASGKAAWGMSTEIINYLKSARNRGIDISANVYPYLASGDGLSRLTPEWARVNGNTKLLENLNDPEKVESIKKHLATSITTRGADAIVIAYPSDPTLHNKSIKTLAEEWGLLPEEVVVKILKANPGTSVFSFVMHKDDLKNFIKEPWIMIGSDGASTHPRAAGTFAKVIGQFALKDQWIDLKSAIHRSTGMTAETFKIKDRGFIRENYFADILIFDPKEYIDKATYAEPVLPPTGVKYVFLNGELVVEDGKHSGTLAGKALKFIEP